MGNYIGIVGIVVLLGIAYAFSSNRKAINLRIVGAALALQAAVAAFVIYFDWGRRMIDTLSQGVLAVIAFSGDGIAMFYAWQHGMGCHEKLPKEQELLQMPGRGELDFTPLVAALCDIEYQGWTEVFMHPVPRGIPILDSTNAVSGEINRARQYLNACLEKV